MLKALLSVKKKYILQLSDEVADLVNNAIEIGNPECKNDKNLENKKKNNARSLIPYAIGLVSDNYRKDLIKEWLEYRIELRKPMKTELGLRKMVNEWGKYSNEQIRAVMDFSIAKEYQGMIWDSLQGLEENSQTKCNWGVDHEF
jgi:hypothetical protein